jgi:molybdopterin synthase catalytic subunit
LSMVEITAEPIPVTRWRAELSHPSCGAVVAFEGLVRDHHEGKKVLRLSYECYKSMALKVLASIREQVLRRWKVERLLIVHRTGEIPIGEAAVLVAAASAHRKEAFEAAAWAMDEIKREAPIWKHETYSDGTSLWVEDHCVGGDSHEGTTGA